MKPCINLKSRENILLRFMTSKKRLLHIRSQLTAPQASLWSFFSQAKLFISFLLNLAIPVLFMEDFYELIIKYFPAASIFESLSCTYDKRYFLRLFLRNGYETDSC